MKIRESPLIAKVIQVKTIRITADGLKVTLTPGKYDTKKPLLLTIAGLTGREAKRSRRLRSSSRQPSRACGG